MSAACEKQVGERLIVDKGSSRSFEQWNGYNAKGPFETLNNGTCTMQRSLSLEQWNRYNACMMMIDCVKKGLTDWRLCQQTHQEGN